MNAIELAQTLELLAKALRLLPDFSLSDSKPQAPIVISPASATPASTVSRTLDSWLEIHEAQVRSKGYKPQTIGNRTANINHVRRLWGARPIEELRAHEVLSSLRAEFLPDRSSTAQRVLAELRDAYNEAIANDWTSTNPATHVKLPTHRVQRKRLAYDTWQKMGALAHANNQTWVECLLLLALITGQRRGDLVKMRFDDIVDGHLQVEQQKQAGKGYGAKIAIPLNLRLDAIGLTLSEIIDRCRLCGKPGPTLLRKSNGQPIEQSSLSSRFHDVIVAVMGEDAYPKAEWPSLHEVRSLSARMYSEQGIDVQTLLGHKHAEMTAAYIDDRGLSASQWKRLSSSKSII